MALTTTTYAFYDVLKHPSFRPWFRTYIVLAGVSIGGAALWAMHFVALAGLRLTTCDGAARVEVTEHNLGLTLVAVVAIATAGAVSMYLVLPTASDALGENAATRTASAASAASTAEAPASADPAALEAGAAKVPTPKQAAITKAKQYTDPPVKTVRHGSIMVIMNGVEHQRRKARDAKAGRTAAQDDAALRRRETVGLDGRPARRMSTLEGMDYWRLRMPPWTACLFSRGDSISIAKFSMRGLVLGTLLMVAASCGVHYMVRARDPPSARRALPALSPARRPGPPCAQEMIGMHGAFVLEYSVGLVVAAAVVTAVASVVLLFSVVQVAYMSDSSMAFVSRAVASLFISVTFNAAH